MHNTEHFLLRGTAVTMLNYNTTSRRLVSAGVAPRNFILRRTDRHHEAKSRCSQFCERDYKSNTAGPGSQFIIRNRHNCSVYCRRVILPAGRACHYFLYCHCDHNCSGTHSLESNNGLRLYVYFNASTRFHLQYVPA
jgi:hypothetical protein